jgi:hypothetical protein
LVTVKSLTPLAEYLDILYTRCATDMPPMAWWIELHPPKTKREGVGAILLKASVDEEVIERDAGMHSIQEGMDTPLNEMTRVAEWHIHKFKEMIP